jgi:predicted nuclease of predicted toxin-antitoxin system
VAEAPELPKFYTDKHVPKAVSRQLLNRGVDIVRCEDVGLGDASDTIHLEYATHEGRVVITNDADFVRLHKEWQTDGKVHAGIMYCLSHVQGEVGVGKIVNVVMLYHELIEGGAGTVETDLANSLIYVS